MKKIALLALLLSGCASNSQPVSSPPTPAPRIASDTTNDVMWVCSEEEVNDSLVWIKCDFARTTNRDSSACLKISYNNNEVNSVSNGWNWISITKRVPICSGLLTATQHEATKYVAFIKREREVLNEYCGNNLTKCTLTAHAIEP